MDAILRNPIGLSDIWATSKNLIKLDAANTIVIGFATFQCALNPAEGIDPDDIESLHNFGSSGIRAEVCAYLDYIMDAGTVAPIDGEPFQYDATDEDSAFDAMLLCQKNMWELLQWAPF